MFILKIQNEDYELPSSWSEITLGRSLKILGEKPPDGYYELISQDKNFNFTNEFWIKTLPVFYGQMIRHLSNIPEKIIEQMTVEQRAKVFIHIAEFVNILFYGKPENIEEINQFTFNGSLYYLPKKITKLGIEYPMADEPMQTFTESADLLLAGMNLKENKLEYAANIVAILCRKEGEKYDERKMLERAEIFKELPMSVVWNVFFCFIKLWNSFIADTANYLVAKEKTNSTIHH